MSNGCTTNTHTIFENKYGIQKDIRYVTNHYIKILKNKIKNYSIICNYSFLISTKT